MHTRTRKCFLVMVMLALAVAPLRGAWSMPMPVEAEDPPHCAQMDMQQQDAAKTAADACDRDCDGTCCGSACNACVNAASALLNTVNILPALHDTPRDSVFLATFPERTLIPPLRPPASL